MQPRLATRSGTETRQKQCRVTFRVSEAELAELTESASRAGQTLSTYVRSRSLAAPTTRARRRPPVEVQALARLQGEMNRVGSNIHQLLRRVNFGDTPISQDIREAFDGYREVIAAILAVLGRVPR